MDDNTKNMQKYFKYKSKYNELKKQMGGKPETFVNHLAKEMEKSFKNFDRHNYSTIVTSSPKLDQSVVSGRFVPEYVTKYIVDTYQDSEDYLKIISTCRNSKNTVTLYTSNNILEMNRLVIQLCFILLDSSIFNEKRTTELTLYLFPTPFEKKFPESNTNPLSPKNINSGYTSFSRNGNYSVVFRREEMFKVTIHELLHQLKNELNLYLESDKYFNYEDSERFALINESYVELMATIINSIVNKIINRIPISRTLNDELKYSRNICSQILNFYRIKNYEHFIKNAHENTNKVKNKDTNTLSYFFIKAALLFNCDNFFEILKTNEKSGIMRFIIESCNSLRFRSFMLSLDSFDNINNIGDNSLKMTITNVI